ncbi:MAG: peptide-methionine (S)-S-oxide reductase [Alphaproteobacteria bacterium]|nr:peptide-methionine (S)-S-oxide reductase [Alphaproteobacteria bacterium]
MKKYIIASMLAFISGGAMADTQMATFAGGCFWCMHGEFAAIDGVSKVVSGYTGGTTKNPTYEQVSTGRTGHIEAIEVTYDAAKVSYDKLLTIFWENIDPLDSEGQFCDKGSQYLAGIFTHDSQQKKLAEESREKVKAKFGQPIASFIRDAEVFYPAEDYHQDYYIKSKARYKMYRMGCGRDAKLEQLWKE